MEWLNGLNRALDYIEAHLEDEMETAAAAQLAACSVFQFQRMFVYLTGVTLTEYIRRRRMTAAAFELIEGGVKVIDLALKYGYDSPTAFNRAFQGVHGVSPTKAKREGIRLTAFPRLTFTISIKGERAMKFRIEKKEAFRIVGYATKLPEETEECFATIPKLWDSVYQGGVEALCALIRSGAPKRILGVVVCGDGASSDYYIAVETDAPVPDGMRECSVPAADYAVFEAVGSLPGAMQETQRRIMTEWLPTSGYQFASAPDIEVYPEGDQQAEDYRSEIWVPVIRK